MSIASLIEELKDAYARAGLDCGDELLPPARKEELDVLAAELAMPLPAELIEVYGVHGGQRYVVPGITGLFGHHRLLSPREVLKHHQMLSDNCLLDPLPRFPPSSREEGYWVPQLIPFASWDAYDLCIDRDSGGLWEFVPNSGLIRHRPSIEAVLREVLELARAGKEPQLKW